MCGIVGYVGGQEAWPIIFEGLRRLEYRGYDSAGIAIVDVQGDIQLRKTVGKVNGLEGSGPVPQGSVGLGHTRWATHGRPSHENAHPHIDCEQRIAVVHNGIVENYLELKRWLIDAGHVFVDGLGMWDEQVNVIDERRMLSEDGIVNVIIPRNAATGRIMGAPHITSAGFVSDEDAEKLFKDTVEELRNYLDRARTGNLEWTQLEASVKGTVEKFLHKRTRRRPLVVPVAIDI